MTLFGIVWLILLFFTIIKNKRSMLVTLVLLSSTLQSSNVAVINGQGIGPQIITSAVASVYFLTYKMKKMKINISKSIFTINRSLLILFVYIAFDAVRTGTFISNFLRIIQLFFYILCFICMVDAGKLLDDKYVYRTLKRITIFILITGLIQILCTTEIIPRYWFIRDLFWNDSVNNPEVVQFMWPYGRYFRFFSTYMEPSYFVCFSIGAMIYFINNKYTRKKDMWLIVSLAIATILSFSSSGYGTLLILAIIYITFSKEGKTKIAVLISGVIVLAIFYKAFYGILDDVIFSKMTSGSAAARQSWNLEAIRTFHMSPIMGVGYKNCRASSLFYTILAELGIVGLVIYIIFIINIIWPIFTKRWQNRVGTEHIGICFAIISVIITQMIGVPDLDICAFWMWMNFLGLIIGRSKKMKLIQEINYEQL